MQVFSGRYGSRMANLMGIQDDNFRGGARVTFGDFNGDGTPDLAVATGFLGGPRVAVFDGLSVLAGRPAKLVRLHLMRSGVPGVADVVAALLGFECVVDGAEEALDPVDGP